MPPSDCSCSEEAFVDQSPSRFHHDKTTNAEYFKSSESLEETLSLTCDDSMESTLSSASSSDIIADTDTSVNEIKVHQSPDILRRRLLPLAPSPIRKTVKNITPSIRPSPESKILLRKRPVTRILWLTLATVTFFLATTTDLRQLSATINDAKYSDESRQWRQFLRNKAPKIIQKISRKSASREYTISIKGQRLDLVLQSLDFHTQCPSVKSVQVEWADQNNPIPVSILHHKSGIVEAYGKPSTQAVFLLDEDVLLTCDEMERGTSFPSHSLIRSDIVHSLTTTTYLFLNSLPGVADRPY